MPTSLVQSLAIPFCAIGIAVDLENKGTSEKVQKIGKANFQSALRYFIVTQIAVDNQTLLLGFAPSYEERVEATRYAAD